MMELSKTVEMSSAAQSVKNDMDAAYDEGTKYKDTGHKSLNSALADYDISNEVFEKTDRMSDLEMTAFEAGMRGENKLANFQKMASQEISPRIG